MTKKIQVRIWNADANPNQSLNQTMMTHAEDTILGKEFLGTDPTNQEYLTHYGVLGMKWGVRKQRPRSSGSRGTSSKSVSTGLKAVQSKLSSAKTKAKRRKSIQAVNKQKKIDKKTNNPKKMSDAELHKRIERLELEKQYKTLKSGDFSKGKKVLENILSKSAENIGTQLMTYVFGESTNSFYRWLMKQAGKTTSANIVNPRKGQKDK